jgi:hypothetical protein
VRSLAGVPSGAIVMPNDFWGKSNAPVYFMAGVFTPSGSYGYQLHCLTIDSLNNVTAWGFDQRASPNRASLTKFVCNQSGSVTVVNDVVPTDTSLTGYSALGAITDSSGNVYVSTSTYKPSLDQYTSLLLKYNSSGTLVATANNNLDLTGYGFYGKDITVDSSGNIYQASGDGYWDGGAILKYNSSLALLGTYAYSYYVPIINIAADTIGNIIIGGYIYDYCCGGNTIILQSLPSSSLATPTWGRQFFGGSSSIHFIGSGVDGANNAYIAMYDNSSTRFYLFKYNSSGTFQWSRYWDVPSGGGMYSVTNIAFDSSNNVYLVYGYNRDVVSGGTTYSVGSIAIAKFNSSGTIQFFRSLYCTTTGSGPSSGYPETPVVLPSPRVKIKDNALYFTGIINNTSFAFVFKVPTDGSLTQSFTIGGYNMVYGTISYTVNTYGDGVSATNTLDTYTTTSSSISLDTSTITPNTAVQVL